MKRTIINSISVACMAMLLMNAGLFTSCTDLSEEVYSEIVSDDFTPSESDNLSFVVSGYTPFRLLFAGNSRWFDLQEETGNCLITGTRAGGGWDDGGRYKRHHFHDWTSEQPQFNTVWDKIYEGVSKCNQLIYQFESGAINVSSGKENILAELRALRAIYYYTLLDLFGNVPLVTDFNDLNLPTTTDRRTIFEFVEKEMLECIPNLLERDGLKNYARITQTVARGILMRIYLNAKVYIGQERYDDCIAQCNEIIGTGLFELQGYLAPFHYNNESSKENIFVIQCDDRYATGAQQFLKFFHNLATKVYQMTPSAWNGTYLSPQFLYSYQAGDKRKGWTWLQGEQKDPNGNTVFSYINDINDIYFAKEFAGYRPGKYTPRPGLAAGYTSNDVVVIRYAEVLYAKAECLLRKGGAGNETEAARLVSSVRSRAFDTEETATVDAEFLKGGSRYPWGIYVRERQGTDTQYVEEVYEPGDPLPDTITERQTGDDIELGGMLDEWLWEFAAEAQNRMHLIRFGAYTTKKWFNHRPNETMGTNITLFAIPQQKLNQNTNLSQNPGY